MCFFPHFKVFKYCQEVVPALQSAAAAAAIDTDETAAEDAHAAAAATTTGLSAVGERLALYASPLQPADAAFLAPLRKDWCKLAKAANFLDQPSLLNATLKALAMDLQGASNCLFVCLFVWLDCALQICRSTS